MRMCFLRALLLSALYLPVLVAQAQAPNPLLDLLKSPNADQRAKAASELGKQGGSSAVPALTAALNDPSAKVRRQVVVALAEIRGGESLDGLITASRDTDPQVRVVAVDALSGYYLGRAPSIGFVGGLKHATESRADESVPIDPGVHAVAASAPGRRPWSTNVQLPPRATTLAVTVPALESLPAASSVPVPTPR